MLCYVVQHPRPSSNILILFNGYAYALDSCIYYGLMNNADVLYIHTYLCANQYLYLVFVANSIIGPTSC